MLTVQMWKKSTKKTSKRIEKKSMIKMLQNPNRKENQLRTLWNNQIEIESINKNGKGSPEVAPVATNQCVPMSCSLAKVAPR